MDLNTTWPQPSWVTVTAIAVYLAGRFLDSFLKKRMYRLQEYVTRRVRDGDPLPPAAAERTARKITRLDLLVRWGSTSVYTLGASVYAAQIVTLLLFTP